MTPASAESVHRLHHHQVGTSLNSEQIPSISLPSRYLACVATFMQLGAAVLAGTVVGCSSPTASNPDTAAAGGVAMAGGHSGSGSQPGGSGSVAASGYATGGAENDDPSAGGASVAGAASPGAAGDGGRTKSGGGGTAGAPNSDGDRCDVAAHDPANPPRARDLTGDLGTHDPVIVGSEGKFYLFSTGNNIGAKTSNDLLRWQAAPDVFTSSTRPAWLAEQVPGVSNLWAPDISFFGGAYHLYYSASTFGKNRSCIGHLTRTSLALGTWTDQGPVICSNVSTQDDFNAIDPNVVVDRDGTPWLSFGSFWSGIQLIQLDEQGARVGDSLVALASRPSAGGALEAPFIVRRCGYYYLFVSFDKCCSGVNSTYNIRVGRAAEVKGPYVDRDGKALLQGGGSLVLAGAGRWHGQDTTRCCSRAGVLTTFIMLTMVNAAGLRRCG
jgi:arabinan endo-1,5-alpha-L-arabinosidase